MGLPPLSVRELRGPEELTLDSRNFGLMPLSPPGKELYWEQEWVWALQLTSLDTLSKALDLLSLTVST